MKGTFRRKLFFSFVIIFLLFTVGIVLLEQSRERGYKTEILEEKLDVYTHIVGTALSSSTDMPQTLDSLLQLFPPTVRITVINRQGEVLYDNAIEKTIRMQNHSGRPEIVSAREKGTGSDIRISSSNKKEYLYYARRFNPYFVRMALPYDIHVQNFLQSDNFFLYYVIALFIITLFIINYASDRFSESIRKLRDFASHVESTTGNMQLLNLKEQFPDDELGEVGAQIAQNFQRLKASEKEIALEREKLLQHVHSSEEGVCFFSANRTIEFHNGLFIQYLNTIADELGSDLSSLFNDASFAKINDFLSNREHETYFETQITKQGKTFVVRANVFDNGSFEIIINDITKQEKTRQLKQEMTGNITHELRTPVTAIRGCLETILEYPLNADKQHYFVEKAYKQVLSLSELIQDMSLITRIEDASHSFRMENVSILLLLEDLKKDLEIPLQEKNMQLQWNITDKTVVRGNQNLLYSIFRNLTENAIRYAGNNVSIYITQYNEDRDFYYFSYADTGIGISDDQHLNRLFERFYRINEGRTRDTGGSGLGLSIVKNAILFHKGNIVAKNRATGGLEFLFKLSKKGE
jgi:signal transduction histidine kinase